MIALIIWGSAIDKMDERDRASRSVMPLNTLGRTRTTMPASKRGRLERAGYIGIAGVVGIEGWNFPS